MIPISCLKDRWSSMSHLHLQLRQLGCISEKERSEYFDVTSLVILWAVHPVFTDISRCLAKPTVLSLPPFSTPPPKYQAFF